MDPNDPLDLATLLCSRLCHDLAGPVGAVGNGVELLAATGAPSPQDMALTEQSARAAADALAFHRVAFGAAARDGAPMPMREIGALARAYLAGPRLALDWPADAGSLDRERARALLLLLLTAAKAAPMGGILTVAPPEARPLRLEATLAGPRCALSPMAVALLSGAPPPEPPTPREAHLALLARAAARLGAQVRIEAGPERLTLALVADR